MGSSFSTEKNQNDELPPGVIRFGSLGADVLEVSDPDLIRKLDSHGDLTRPAHAKLPWFFSAFFPATKFYSPGTDSWATTMHDEGTDDQRERRDRVVQALAKGFTPVQVSQIEQLIKGTKDIRDVGIETAKIIGSVFLPFNDGEVLPQEIAEASFDLIRLPDSAKNPIKYFGARRARARAEAWVRQRFPEFKYPGDIVHDLSASAQGVSLAIMRLRRAGNQAVVPFLSTDAVIHKILRFPSRATTLGGIVSDAQPLQPGKSVVVMNIGSAVAKTQDERFLFGAGTDYRQCPFKPLFLSTANTIRDKNL